MAPIQLVTPRVVRMAERMLIISCMMYFMVSFFIAALSLEFRV